ncbi:MAG: hypothetical protein PVS2B1_05140 [Candidatus Dormibacteraceae bacterium]
MFHGRELGGLIAAPRDPANDQVVLAFQDCDESGSQERMVLHDEHPHRGSTRDVAIHYRSMPYQPSENLWVADARQPVRLSRSANPGSA